MKIRINEILKNQKGSSLAFVIIIGMIIMIMVVSLLSVANSDFTFTQQTVESRQAYIDAKSVIEFGKIEIHYRKVVLQEKNIALKNLYIEYGNEKNNTNPDAVRLAALKEDIDQLEAEIINLEAKLKEGFNIYGDTSKVSETLTDEDLSNGDDIICIGKVNVSNPEENKYQYTIETQELRRKLTYQTDFTYRLLTASTVTEEPPPGPTVMLPKPSVDWDKSFFHLTGKGVQMNTSGYGNIKKNVNTLVADFSSSNADIDVNKGFVWEKNTALILTANNVCFTDPIPTVNVLGSKFNITALGTPAKPATKKTPATPQKPGQIRFETNYNQVNGNRNKLTAENIVFVGDLVIDQNSYLEIKCTNLWVGGNIIIRTNDPADASFINRITAKNIYVGRATPNNKTITVVNKSRVVWTCEKFQLNDQITNEYDEEEFGNLIFGTPGLIEDGQDKYY